MTNKAGTLLLEPERTLAAYRRDLYRARLVIVQLRDETMASGSPFQVADPALDATAPDELWDGLEPTSWKKNRSASTWSPGQNLRWRGPSAPGWKFWGVG